jgi:cysteine desulfurase/selenocysteine lyase
VAKFFNADRPDEIIFLRGATEAINLVAYGYGRKFLTAGDEILVGAAEHHANYLPWEILESEIGILRRVIPLDGDGDVDLDGYDRLFSKRTKLVAIQHIGNVTGAINDVAAMAKIAHGHGAKILVDGACSICNGGVDLAEIDCDFFACSGHKGFAPMGSGFLFGKYDLLRAMAPYQVGGNVVVGVRPKGTSYKLPPDRFEAGTPDVAAVVGLGAAIDFLRTVDWPSAREYLDKLLDHLGESLRRMPGVVVYGNPRRRTCALSFNLKGIHCHDVATYLGNGGIAIRAGTHCAQPLMHLLGIPGTARFSLALYNTVEEIDTAVAVLDRCRVAFP